MAVTKSGEVIALLPVGTRIRSIQHPELTGYIKAHEYADREHISPIPYLIGWDDSQRAAETLGWFFVYASNGGVESVESDR
jgi:hypothetical protein